VALALHQLPLRHELSQLLSTSTTSITLFRAVPVERQQVPRKLVAPVVAPAEMLVQETNIS
jgi:hypothetical protein